jgi:uncharacterized secreted protein with C-terminal beta-propeller domain
MSWTADSADRSHYSSLFDSNDSISASLTMQVDSTSIGAERNLYLAARLQDSWYMRNDQGHWVTWTGQVGDLVPFTRKTLSATEVIEAHSNAPLPPGEYAVYGGYETENDAIIYNQQPLTFIVFNADKPSLHRFRSEAMLENYLLEAMTEIYASENRYSLDTDTFEPSPSIEASVSQTNLQEQGVDEADRIKTDGEYLYSLGNCLNETSNKCLFTYRIAESPASNQLMAETSIPGEAASNGFYLLKERSDDLTDLIVTVGAVVENDYMSGDVLFIGGPSIWEEPRVWYEGKTEVNIFNLNSATSPAHDRTLTFDGAIISSRVIEDTLYLVTRHTPTVDGLNQYAFDTESYQSNRALLENTSLTQLLPSAIISEEETTPLIEAEQCYLPPSATTIDPDPTIINIIAIPLADPDNLRTTCFLGASEELYASQKAIYLVAIAATQAPLSEGGFSSTSEIHKLALTSNTTGDHAADYRGSVQILGHLGSHPDYKSFRMGEHEGILRIATSIGYLGSANSSTSVTLLRESPDGQRLEEAGRLDDLGRPEEALYACRFLGDRGYLVTFKKVDPLYVLDLSDPENPIALGELEVSGFSEYLHPVGENYLLGIGKEAIDAENSSDRGGLGFAWYQGLKISLFDVTDPTTPTEVNSIVLGGRGTSSTITSDHHAFASLPQTDQAPMRFSIPVDLHNESPGESYPPYATWGWTHTGLYTFDVQTGDTPGVELIDQFVVDQNSESRYSTGIRGDRSVILGDSVHYLHDETLYSSSLPTRE